MMLRAWGWRNAKRSAAWRHFLGSISRAAQHGGAGQAEEKIGIRDHIGPGCAVCLLGAYSDLIGFMSISAALVDAAGVNNRRQGRRSLAFDTWSFSSMFRATIPPRRTAGRHDLGRGLEFLGAALTKGAFFRAAAANDNSPWPWLVHDRGNR